jgi:hypothetical protein
MTSNAPGLIWVDTCVSPRHVTGNQGLVAFESITAFAFFFAYFEHEATTLVCFELLLPPHKTRLVHWDHCVWTDVTLVAARHTRAEFTSGLDPQRWIRAKAELEQVELRWS